MRTAPHRVVLAVTYGMPIFEASVPCEVFGIDRPDLASPWYSFSVVGLGEPPLSHGPGFWLSPADDMGALARADTLDGPPCGNVHDDPPAPLVDAVRAAHDRGVRLVSICSGAFILAAAGILDGRRATTHWMHAAELTRRYPAIQVDPNVLYVDDADVITSAGTAAGIDACLHVVRVDHGAAVAAPRGWPGPAHAQPRAGPRRLARSTAGLGQRADRRPSHDRGPRRAGRREHPHPGTAVRPHLRRSTTALAAPSTSTPSPGTAGDDEPARRSRRHVLRVRHGGQHARPLQKAHRSLARRLPPRLPDAARAPTDPVAEPLELAAPGG